MSVISYWPAIPKWFQVPHRWFGKGIPRTRTSPAAMAEGRESSSVWGGGGRGGKQRLPLPITAWNGTGTCLPAASAPTSSTSAAAGIQAEENNNPVPGRPEINVSSMCVFLVKILALKLSRGSGKTCACGIYRKCKRGNQFASWKLSSEVFSRPVKPHPWPLPRRSTRPHRNTGNAGSDFRIF